MVEQNNNSGKFKSRLPLLSWTIIPFLGMWLSINYLIGMTKRPLWVRENQLNGQILSSQTEYQNNSSGSIPVFKWQGTGLITFWFDDAWYSQYSTAFPILNEKNFVAALAVPTGLIGGDSYMSWAHVKRLQYKRWEITSHTRNHVCESNIDLAKLEFELRAGKEDLQAHNLNSDHFVNPCGISSVNMDQLIKKYYLSSRSSGDGINNLPIQNPYNLYAVVLRLTTSLDDIKQKILLTKEQKGWLILVFHQIDNSGTDYSLSVENFKKIVQFVEEANIPIVLPSQALEAVSDNQR